MAAFAGRQTIIQIDAVPVAAMTTRSLEISNELIDISSDDSGNWVTKLESLVGSKQVSISLSGVLDDETLFTNAFASNPSATIDFIFPTDLAGSTTGPTVSGTFLLTSFGTSGDYADKTTYDVSFESSGVITFTAGV